MTVHTHIVGAGLMGTSIGLGLSAEGWPVSIADSNPDAQTLAHSLGAGSALDGEPDLVLVCVPPSLAPDEVVRALTTWPSAVVSDIASVKSPVERAVTAAGLTDRYVGSHPMAGRELSGGIAAQGDLFRARPWVVCRNGATDLAVQMVRDVATALGSEIVDMDAARHDATVARVSHTPQVVSSAVAASLGSLEPDDVALAGQGLRDVTRIAASDPAMWTDIVSMNAAHVRTTLDHIIADLVDIRSAKDIGAAMAALMNRGRAEVARIPGKHGGSARHWTAVTVIVPDEPGQLLSLIRTISDQGINIEDLSMEHSPRQPVGLTTVWVEPTCVPDLMEVLTERGWEIAAT